MSNQTPAAAFIAALLSLVWTSPAGAGQLKGFLQAAASIQWLLGDDEDAARAWDFLPVTRQFGASGGVTGSLAAAMTTEGVPPEAMTEAAEALGTAIDLERHLRDGDRFHVRWEQIFTATGRPIGAARVLWAELVTEARGALSVHRFRDRDGAEQLWHADGRVATPPKMRMPIEEATVSSDFGLRENPLTSPRRALGMGPLPSALAPSWAGARHREAAIRLTHRSVLRVFMHEGVDLAAITGTPIHAAADGVVRIAGPHGGYGNYIRIEHDERLVTAYAHLSRFAPGLRPGKRVVRGELIGKVGNTGRSTGPHLHFEVLSDGKPTNPLALPDVASRRLTRDDVGRFTRLMQAQQADRDREAAPSM